MGTCPNRVGAPIRLRVWDVTSTGVARQRGCFFDHGIRVEFTNSVLQLCALGGAPVAAITLSASNVSVHALFQKSSADPKLEPRVREQMALGNGLDIGVCHANTGTGRQTRSARGGWRPEKH